MHIEFKENEAPKGLQLAMQKLSLKSEKDEKCWRDTDEADKDRAGIGVPGYTNASPLFLHFCYISPPPPKNHEEKK